MKSYQTISLLLLFCTSLLSGFLIGRGVDFHVEDSNDIHMHQFVKPHLPPIKETGEGSAEDGQTLPDSSPKPVGNHQQNILVIGVDDLGAPTPRLTSVWLIIHLKDSPHMMLLPIYPSGDSQPSDSSSMDTMDGKFKLTPQHTLESDFVRALNEKEIWWTGQIIVDEYSLADVVDFVAGANDNSLLDGVDAITSIPSAWATPSDSLIGQAALIKALCQNSSGLSSVPRWQYLHLFAMTQDHFSTDFDAEEALDQWQNLLSSGGGVSCEFPSMASPNLRP
jgi:hypothetical protein